MKKAAAIYGIVVGISIILLWTMLLATGQVTELKTEPIRILFHIISELITAIFLVFGGILLIKKVKIGKYIHFISLGMLFYSVLNAEGYYIQFGDVAMTVMFTCLTVATTIFIISAIIGSIHE